MSTYTTASHSIFV